MVVAIISEVGVPQTDRPPVCAFIGLGSNLKDPLLQLRAAVQSLDKLTGVGTLDLSSVYQTEPMGPADQPDYLNAVARLSTQLSATRLLDHLQLIENRAGRIRDRRWGPRSLDLDLLLYGQETINSLRLTVPHRGIAERSFVLYPLAELEPGLLIPGKGPVGDLLDRCPRLGIRQLQSKL